MTTTFYSSKERGHADYGWLDTNHSFSFGSYYDSSRMNFGALRVLNDDKVAPGEGFGRHPHNNMEIISIPLSGALAHSDSMGHEQTIGYDEVQVMTAGSGIEHAEYNQSDTDAVSFLQIWIFPRAKGLTPQYAQKKFQKEDRINKFQLLVHPETENQALSIHQDAWISRINPQENSSNSYRLFKPGNGVYIFVIEGEISVQNQVLKKRDALTVEHSDTIEFTATKEADVLFIEVPMQW